MRIATAEQLSRQRRAEHALPPRRVLVDVDRNRPRSMLEPEDRLIGSRGRRARGSSPTSRRGRRGRKSLDERRCRRGRAAPAPEPLGVVRGQPPPARPDAPEHGGLRATRLSRPSASTCASASRARALADRHHRDHRGHAEHDAEHAQRRAQLVTAQRFGWRCAGTDRV